MQYISLDIETTGLDPATCQVIEIAAVFEDTTVRRTTVTDYYGSYDMPRPSELVRPQVSRLPTFHTLVRHNVFVGDEYALEMNKEIIKEAQGSGVNLRQAIVLFEGWLADLRHDQRLPINYKFFVAGKNVGIFDLQFFPRDFVRKNFHHRTIDPGSTFIDWEKGPPSLTELVGHDVKHRALEDARDVIRVLRRAYT